MSAIIRSKADVVVLRSCGIYMFFCFLPLLYLRALGRRIVIDIPSPISTSFYESRSRKRAIVKMVFYEVLLHISFPLSLIPANKIVQYAKERSWFNRLLAYKTLEIGNSVDVDSIRVRARVPKLGDVLNLVGVANVADWHGFDRMINSIRHYYDLGLKYKVNFYIIGDGMSIGYLRGLVEEKNLSESVHFIGVISGDSLYSFYESMHIGVAALALDRKNMVYASELKTREYTSVGIPFIISADDPDFITTPYFCHRVSPNSDLLIDIEEVIGWYKSIETKEQSLVSDMRRYANINLDYQSKIGNILL
jgi:glycosyltransferase involved in cell wall biosynthesis